MYISHMTERISDGAELFLRSLEQEMWCEIANREIGASGASYKYPSRQDAVLAMLRQAYLRGREDVIDPFEKRDFDADVQRVQDANKATR